MESIRTVNRDDIAERFAPYALSSGKGSHVLHNNPQAQSLKKTKKALGPATSRHSPSSARLLPQTSIQAGYGMEPISSVSSGAEPRGGLVEPQVLEPVEIAPADQMFTGKGHGIMEETSCCQLCPPCRITKMFKKLKQKLARWTQKCLHEKKKITWRAGETIFVQTI
ncbi:uncharacterized protein LOC110764637 isoform X2 [Prunus avium]|nr:uncharacterized protein LOC110764637 isoform X2 [Prunus avium]XP_021823337.1 uncharacterized protein LOC110764637 isoform X2 [Prunus avium]